MKESEHLLSELLIAIWSAVAGCLIGFSSAMLVCHYNEQAKKAADLEYFVAVEKVEREQKRQNALKTLTPEQRRDLGL